MTDPLIDTVVAQYQVLSRLGGGAMGVVYKARDLKLGRFVALKFLPYEWSHDEDAKQRFVREAQAASSADHANICTVHDIQSTEDGRLFIVMAFYDGGSLKQRLARGAIPVAEALDIATQVADGLARAHAAGVVHRDVKPANVMLTEDAVKIVDFGLATLAGGLQLTQAGSPVGTVGYMAPEQLRGLAATPQSDVWAVGVMLYEMLRGHPPFQGAYAEAVSYAIRHETPPALREARPEIGEAVEQLVFRALHKEPGVRFASGRELARALRQVQGHSVPLDLQTAPVDVPRALAAPPRRRRWPVVVAVAVALLLAAGAAAWFLMRPPPRTFVAITPVVNGTGDASLDPYRLGLTLELTRELGASADVRVWPYGHLLQPLRRFLQTGGDVSGEDAVRAIAASSGAGAVVVPTLLYEAGAWKARAEVRDRGGAVVGHLETPSIESSLSKEAASALIVSLAEQVERRFRGSAWRLGGGTAGPVRFQSLEAARAFEEGFSAFDVGEFAAARDAFAKAAREDPRHPLPAAWQARVAHLTGDRSAAVEAADRAEARLSTASPAESMFVQAVVAEARRQPENAARWYQAFAAADPDDQSALTELAGYQDRSGRITEAVASYRRLLQIDPRQPGPALELCRLYNPARMNDVAMARAFGERARRAYATFGSPAGEAHAMLCLSDVLRGGTPAERAESRRLATHALEAFQSLGLQYSEARAHFYVASAARAEDDLTAAAAALERALTSARIVGNTSLEGTVYINLGITYNTLGNRTKALDYYRQSYGTAERGGDERRAAYSRANAGALLIEFGSPPDEGRRFVEGALRVVRNLGDRNFEVFCLQIIAVNDRLTGRLVEARKGLGEALVMARDRGFSDRMPSLLLDDGRTLMDMGEYVEARSKFETALKNAGTSAAPELLIELARLRTRLGDFAAAAGALEQAHAAAGAAAAGLAPRLSAAAGALAYAQGHQKEARAAFDRAARLWTDDLPDAASVESRAYAGFLDDLDGREHGRQAVTDAMRQAARMKRPALEATIRTLLAQIELRAHRATAALAAVADVPVAPLSPELRAQVHHWRAEAQDALMPGSGEPDRREAQRSLEQAEGSVPSELRERYLLRPELQALATLRR